MQGSKNTIQPIYSIATPVNKTINIGNRSVGAGHGTFIIAEMSGNHNQSFERAIEIVHAAKEAGADAIKLQTYTADTITIDCSNKFFKIQEGSPWAGQTLYDLYKKAYTPWEWHQGLKEEADKLGLIFISTPFDNTAVDYLEDLNVPAYKVASFELIDIPLIKYIAEKGKPVIMSTGMGTLDEIEEAVKTVRDTGNDQLILLKCVSAYPAHPEDMNLNTIPDIARKFGLQAGLSDHTLDSKVSVTAVSLGATVIEKHLTLSRKEGGPDAGFSMEPDEFREMVNDIRLIEKALGSIRYEPTERESKNKVFRRSLFVVQDVNTGDMATNENVRSIRPGHGLSPKYIEDIIGKVFKNDIPKGTPVDWDLFNE